MTTAAPPPPLGSATYANFATARRAWADDLIRALLAGDRALVGADDEKRRANGIRQIAAPLAALDLREEADADTPTLFGHFAVFNRWTLIDSWFEGRFMERIAPGALKKTMRESRPSMRVLFNHGSDPEVGDKPIAQITDLREDGTGAYYEASLFPGIPPLVMDGLRAGQYGASFRFKVVREEFSEDPGVSEDNPTGMPERTIKEASVPEFGPVTFPAYPEASAQVRSLTDSFVLARFVGQDPDRLATLVTALRAADESQETAPPEESAAGDGTDPEEGRTQETAPAPGSQPTPPRSYLTRPKENQPWRLP
jgi:HK97 family phage prohead protease